MDLLISWPREARLSSLEYNSVSLLYLEQRPEQLDVALQIRPPIFPEASACAHKLPEFSEGPKTPRI